VEIGNLKVRLGVDADTFKLKDFAHALGEIPFSVAAGITSLTGMSFELKDLIENSISLANNLTDFTATTGQSAISLQKWASVAQQVTGEGKGVESSIRNIGAALAALKSGTPQDAFLQAAGSLHVGTSGNYFSMLKQALINANNFKDKNQAAGFLKQMGIDPSLMQMSSVLQNPALFNKMATVLQTPEQTADFKRFEVKLEEFKEHMEMDFIGPITQVLPLLDKLGGVISDFLKNAVVPLATGIGNIRSNTAGKRLLGDMEFFVPGSRINRQDTAEAYRTVVNVTQNIESMAESAKEVAAQVVSELLNSHFVNAMKQSNNSGR
jgi:hypothetical protein